MRLFDSSEEDGSSISEQCTGAGLDATRMQFSSPSNKLPKSILISHVPVRFFTVEQLVNQITGFARGDVKRIVTYANVHTVNIAAKTEWFRKFLQEGVSIVFCDGFGLLLGARLLGHKVHHSHRMTLPDFLEQFACSCAAQKLSLYMLAGKPGVVELAIERLKRIAPELQVYGRHGYFAKSGRENDAVLEEISAKRPDILMLGLGSPLQEQWLKDNISRLNAKVYFPVGKCLDFYSGVSWRGPHWMTDYGLEWLCRLVSEPMRLGKRYIMGNPQFLARVAFERIRKEVGGILSGPQKTFRENETRK